MADKMAVEIYTFSGGVMDLHVGRDWTMEQITSHIEQQCIEWAARYPKDLAYNYLATSAIVFEFGDIGNPKRHLQRDASGRWRELKPKRWSKAAVKAREEFLSNIVANAVAEAQELRKP